jgi:hypothetical protein
MGLTFVETLHADAAQLLECGIDVAGLRSDRVAEMTSQFRSGLGRPP